VYEAYKKKEWSCQQLVDAHRLNGIKHVENNQTGTMNPSQAARAYFWYFAVADCAANSQGLDLKYSISYINPGNFWWAQFSYDEQGIPQMYLFFSLYYLLLLIMQIRAAIRLHQIDSLHPIVRILSVTVIVHFLSCVTSLIHYLVYGGDGVGAPGLKGLGELLSICAQILIMFICILVGKGWTITTNYLNDKLVIIAVTVLYFVAHLSLMIWDYVGRDPASTLYFYDSVPGLIVILLRLGLTCWFLWCLRTTIQLEGLMEKKNFYVYFGGSFTLWFLLLPSIVAFALILEPWFRMRTVTGMMLSADALAMLVFCILLAPSRASKYFNIKATPQLLAEQERLAVGYGTNTATKGYDEL